MDEGQLRSVFKSTGFRIIATIMTVALVYSLTGQWLVALGIGLFDFTSKLALYYLQRALEGEYYPDEA